MVNAGCRVLWRLVQIVPAGLLQVSPGNSLHLTCEPDNAVVGLLCRSSAATSAQGYGISSPEFLQIVRRIPTALRTADCAAASAPADPLHVPCGRSHTASRSATYSSNPPRQPSRLATPSGPRHSFPQNTHAHARLSVMQPAAAAARRTARTRAHCRQCAHAHASAQRQHPAAPPGKRGMQRSSRAHARRTNSRHDARKQSRGQYGRKRHPGRHISTPSRPVASLRLRAAHHAAAAPGAAPRRVQDNTHRIRTRANQRHPLYATPPAADQAPLLCARLAPPRGRPRRACLCLQWHCSKPSPLAKALGGAAPMKRHARARPQRGRDLRQALLHPRPIP